MWRIVGIASAGECKGVDRAIKALDLQDRRENRMRRNRRERCGTSWSDSGHQYRTPSRDAFADQNFDAALRLIGLPEDELRKVRTDEGYRSMPHLGSAEGLCVNARGLLELEGRLLRNTQSHASPDDVEAAHLPQPFDQRLPVETPRRIKTLGKILEFPF
jgi:hypothetical protein